MSDTTTTPSRVATSEDAGRLLLRLMVGVLMLLHGIGKLQQGIDPIAGMLTSHGLPGVLAYGVYIGEIVAPVLLIVGLWTRAAAVLVVINMIVAIGLAHAGDLALINPKSGGWAVELQMLFLGSAAAIALLGAGRWSVGGMNGRWN